MNVLLNTPCNSVTKNIHRTVDTAHLLGKVVADVLATNKSLQLLGLSDNSLGDEGCRLVMNALQLNSTLRTLSYVLFVFLPMTFS